MFFRSLCSKTGLSFVSLLVLYHILWNRCSNCRGPLFEKRCSVVCLQWSCSELKHLPCVEPWISVNPSGERIIRYFYDILLRKYVRKMDWSFLSRFRTVSSCLGWNMSGNLSRFLSVLDIADPFCPLFLVFPPFLLFLSVFGLYNLALFP